MESYDKRFKNLGYLEEGDLISRATSGGGSGGSGITGGGEMIRQRTARRQQHS